MTSEVLILNKRAVVIGADSAVTTSGGDDHPRYSKTANKIFEISRMGTVAAAIYGSASLDHVPWEIALKLFRKQLEANTFDRVQDYATALTLFLSANDVLFPAALREAEIADQFNTALAEIMKHISKQAPAVTDVASILQDRKAAWDLQAKALEATLDRRGITAPLTSPPLDAILANLQPWIDIAQQQVSADPKLEAVDPIQLAVLGHKLRYMLPEMIFSSTSGIAVTGYGETQIFPAYCRYDVFGHIGHELFYKEVGAYEVTHVNHAMIQPMAQSSMIDMFTDGFGQSLEKIISEKSRDVIDDVFQKIEASGIAISSNLKQSISAACHDAFTIEWKKANWSENYVPLVSVLQSLSVGEMAHLAESLLGLQSLKERVTSASETVGGPIDVAAISKDEGLVWIKRKHYFDTDLNLRFTARLNKSYD